MTKFRWETRSGDNAEIDADRIEFAAGHVVFRDLNHRIILAEQNGEVHHLKQLPE